jgi:hypothetical protein
MEIHSQPIADIGVLAETVGVLHAESAATRLVDGGPGFA